MKLLPFFGDVVFVEDRFDRAFRHARFAVDAFVRMDVQNLLPFVEAFDRANHDAIGVLAAEARLQRRGSSLGFSQLSSTSQI